MILETGIPKLDQIIGGGVEEGSSILISSPPGLDAITFAEHMLSTMLKNNIKGIYFVDNKLPKNILSNIKKMNWKFSLFETLGFIDSFSSALGLASKEKFVVKNALDMKDVSKTIESAMAEMDGNTFAVFDSLSTMVSKHNEKNVLEETQKILKSGKKTKLTSVFLFTDWDSDATALKKIYEMFDYVIELNAIEEKVLMRNYFTVKKAPKRVEQLAIPFRIGLDGVSVFIPKILVTGPFHAGKSTFIHSVSTKAVSVDRLGTTISLDHGYIEYGGLSADLFGTPGQERFTFMLDILNKDAFGIVLLIDSTDPESFPRAKEMLTYVSRYGLPYVISANKQDLQSALSVEEIRKKLDLGKDIPIIPTIAPQKKGSLESVQALIDLIIKKGV